MKKLKSNLPFRKRRKLKVLKIAHAGGVGYAPGNTLKAVKKAVDLKVDVVELDVHQTKDRKIIVMHDHNLKRTTECLGLIHKFSLKEIKQCHKPNGEPVPTLQEVLDILKNRCICKVDIKDRLIGRKAVEILKKNRMEGSAIFSSGLVSVLKTLETLKQSFPKIKIAFGGLKKRIPISRMIKKAKSVNVDIIDIHYSIITKKLIEEAHRNRLEVHAWTIDDKKTIEKMKKIGVDGITSNFPDRI